MEFLCLFQIPCGVEDKSVGLKLMQSRDVTIREAPAQSTTTVVVVDSPREASSSSQCTGTSTTPPGGPPLSSLTQTNCVVLTPQLMSPRGRSKKCGYVEVLDCLFRQG